MKKHFKVYALPSCNLLKTIKTLKKYFVKSPISKNQKVPLSILYLNPFVPNKINPNLWSIYRTYHGFEDNLTIFLVGSFAFFLAG